MAKVSTLVDNFNDNSTDTAKWTPFGSPGSVPDRIREVNGRVEIRPRSGDIGFSGYFSASQYDLTDSQAAIELLQPLRPAFAAETDFLATVTNNSVHSTIENGTLRCFQNVGGTYT